MKMMTISEKRKPTETETDEREYTRFRVLSTRIHEFDFQLSDSVASASQSDLGI